MSRRSLLAFGTALTFIGCTFNWNALDPRLDPAAGGGEEGGSTSVGGQGGTATTTSSTGGTTSTGGSGATGGAGGAGGGLGGGGGAGGSVPSPTCNGQTVPLLTNGVSVVGSTLQAPAQLEGNCASTTGGELVYAFVLPMTADVTVTTELAGTSYDSIPYVREICDDGTTELACEDVGAGDTLVLPALPAGTYYVIVDSHSTSNEGNFEVMVSW
jgi:hypothetical protein